MRVLYHYPLDPASRQARMALSEKKLQFKLHPINPWAPTEAFLTQCPEGAPPCLVDVIAGGTAVITSARAICEYVDDGSSRYPLMPTSALDRAEARRIAHWFDYKFTQEVNAYILYERIEKSASGAGAPDAALMRAGRDHLAFHLEYLTWLLERRDWVAGKQFSLGDIAAGAHISCLDYLAEIRWDKWPVLKDWYQKLKSRPSFQPLLADRIPGQTPPRYYADLDF